MVGGIYGGFLRFSRAAPKGSMIWKSEGQFAEKIMLKQRTEPTIRCNIIES
jgi:hypothetical protein